MTLLLAFLAWIAQLEGERDAWQGAIARLLVEVQGVREDLAAGRQPRTVGGGR
jgi:hypothetical protein